MFIALVPLSIREFSVFSWPEMILVSVDSKSDFAAETASVI